MNQWTVASVLAPALVVGAVTVGPGGGGLHPQPVYDDDNNTITYSRSETRGIVRYNSENTADGTLVGTVIGVVCASIPFAAAAPFCAASGGAVAWGYARFKDKATQAANSNQCLRLTITRQTQVDVPPLPSVTNDEQCVD